MYDPANKHIMMIIYDGLTNSVFHNLVLVPLLEKLEESKNLEITLVSFEPKKIPAQELMRLVPAHNNLHLVVLKRLPFAGMWSLWFGAWQLFRLLGHIPCDEIISRGPLAGWVALKTLSLMAHKNPNCLRRTDKIKLPSVTIQARGLCAEEYRYEHLRTYCSWLNHTYHAIRYFLFRRIERVTYKTRERSECPQEVYIEAVSPALKDFLIKNFKANADAIKIAHNDLPKQKPKNVIDEWRTNIRRQLNIPEQAMVYCYSGSYKPWQCPEQTIEYFVQQYKNNKNSFLLILSQDKELFIQKLNFYNLPKESFIVTSVSPHYLLEYLAAADFGLLFRESDVINWVSRPTKMLEYQAVGIPIIHNNTVAWLMDQKSSNIFMPD